MIFLADDPAAAAKIPTLLSKLQEHTRSSGGSEYFPPSRSVTPEPQRFSPDTRITLADTEYTLLDLQSTIEKFQGRTSVMGTPTVASTEIKARLENMGQNDIETSRHNSGYPHRTAFNKYEFRKPFDQIADANSVSSVISKEAGSFGGFPSTPFSRSRTNPTPTRSSLNMTRVTRELLIK